MNYHDILRSKIEIMITNDLTIGRCDDDLIPFTSDEIRKFIEDNNNNIEKVIQNMITDYSNDGEIEDPLFDWIGEYLYNLVNTHDL